MQIVHLLPHFAGDHVANLARVLTCCSNAADDAVGVVPVQEQETDDVFGGPRGVALIEAAPVAGGVYQRQPGFGAARWTIQGHRLTHFHKA